MWLSTGEKASVIEKVRIGTETQHHCPGNILKLLYLKDM